MGTRKQRPTPHQTSHILTWNANGILSRTAKLTQFLHFEDISIAMISETHLTDRSYTKIRGYNLYTCNHPNGVSNRGSAVYIHSNLVHDANVNYCTSALQGTCITPILHHNITVNLAAVYCPPNSNTMRPEFLSLFQHLS